MYGEKLFYLFFAFINCSNLVMADAIETKLQAFIPKGWKILSQAEGDLNSDQQADLVLILENTDPKNIVNDGSYDKKPENSRLNLNARKLLVLFKDDQTYRQIASNDALPSESNSEKKCLIDPLIVDHSPIIQNGLLKISLNFGFRCESWEVFNNVYTFRYQNQVFNLIGYDLHYFDLPSGNSRSESTDFLTRRFRKSLSTPKLDLKHSPQLSQSKLKKADLLKLEQINFGLYVHR